MRSNIEPSRLSSALPFSPTATRDILLSFAVAMTIGFGWLYVHCSTPNERARIYLTASIVDEGNITVSREVNQWRDLWDLANKDGRWFANKPPGSSLLGAVVYAPLRWAAPEAEWNDADILLLMRFGLMLPLTLLGFIGFRKLLRLLDVSEAAVDISSLAWVLGTAAFFFTTAFFSHHLLAVLFILTLWVLEHVRRSRLSDADNEKKASDAEPDAPPDSEDSAESPDSQEETGFPKPTLRQMGLMGLAGALLGMAGTIEYQAGVTCFIFALYVFAVPEWRHRKLLGTFVLGTIPFILELLWYHHAAFGHPLELSYLNHRGGGVAHMWPPRWEYFTGLLFSPHRGFLTTGPFLILAFPGAWYLYKRGRSRLTGFLVAAILFRIVFLSGYKWWNGDWGFGPRHFISSYGFLALLGAVTADRWVGTLWRDWLVRGLAIAGVLYNQIVNAFVGNMPLSSKNPIYDFVIPLWHADMPTPNVVRLWTPLDGVTTLIPLAVVVAGVVGFLIARGLSLHPGWPRRAAHGVLAVVPTVALGVWLHTSVPKWGADKKETWLEIVELWENYEQDYYEGKL